MQPPPFYEDSSDEEVIQILDLVVAAHDDDHEKPRAKRRYVNRDREHAQDTLMRDYFVDDPKFSDAVFRTRFRMSKPLFLKIVHDINERFEWFQHRVDARNKGGFTCLQKCTSAIKQLATGNIPDSNDEYMCMSARVSRECLEHFCDAIVELYFKEYLRHPSTHDIQRLYEAHGEKHGIPGMLGSIDCTHWVWRSCPTRFRAQYHRGDHQYPTIMLEAITSTDLWFWHAFFGPAGCNNDINVLNQSPLFTKALTGRKDVERAFGVLKAKWAILARPARPVIEKKLRNMMYACIIMHNMILKDDGNAISPEWIPDPPINEQVTDQVYVELRSETTHFQIKSDLIQHIDTNLDIQLPEN